MNPLSFRTYILRNLNKVIPFLLIISLSLVVILMSKLFVQSIGSDYEASTNFWGKYSTITINTAEFRNGFAEIKNELDGLSNAENVVIGIEKKISINTLLGRSPFEVHFIDQAAINSFKSHVGWKLIEGRLPESGENEIALTNEALKNKNLKLGDKVGSNIDEDEDLKGEFTVVGVLEGSSINGGLSSINVENEPTSIWTFYVQPKAGKEKELNNELAKVKSTYKNQVTYKNQEIAIKTQTDQFGSINQIIWSINVLTSVVMTMSIILLAYIFIVSRLKEFAIFEALGYQRTRIILKVLTEFSFIAMVAWVLGFLITELVSALVNYFLLDPVAITPITVLSLDILLFSLPMLFILSISMIVLVIGKFRNMDPISIIEQR